MPLLKDLEMPQIALELGNAYVALACDSYHQMAPNPFLDGTIYYDGYESMALGRAFE